MTRFLSALFLQFLFVLTATPIWGQVPTGAPPFGSFGGGPDVINLGDLNIHLSIPVLNKPGRGVNFTYNLSYDSSVWYPVTSQGITSWQPVANWGWSGQTDSGTGFISYSLNITKYWVQAGNGAQYQCTDYTYSNYVYHDTFAVKHPFVGQAFRELGNHNYCGSLPYGFSATSTDGSGFNINVTASLAGTSAYVTSTRGKATTPPTAPGYGSATVVDRNGNELSVDASGHFYDTLSSQTFVLTASGSGNATSPIVLAYPAPSGSNASYQMNYTNYTVATNFGTSTIGEYKSPAAVPLVSSIVLPDGSQYSFTYETTPSLPASGACTPYAGTACVTARLASVTLPTGGKISYNYYNLNNNFPACTTGNNGILSDGSASCLQRSTPDTSGTSWIYARTPGTGAASTTKITDPQGNVTAIQFQGIYETQRVTNSGASTVLATTNTCYNGASIPCTGSAITLPITSRVVSNILPGTGNLTDQHVYTYDSYGNLLGTSDYDYGSTPRGSLLGQTTVTYASLQNIKAFQKTVTVTNGSGQTVSQTNYNYDETAVVATSGTPQHTSVTGSRGNLTSVNSYTQGSTYLTQRSTYFDTGNVQTATDVNGAQSTFVYNDATSTCGNSFPNSVNEPLSMSRTFTWNCPGGVQLTVKDENSQTTTTAYTDPYFWRPASVSYPDGGQTSWTYNSPTSTTTTAKMNSSQNIVSTTLLDGLGRAKQSQLNSDPIGPDYVDTTYDALGRTYTVSNPYRTTSDPTYGLTTYQYDALSRPTLVIPPDGSQSSNNASASYTNNCATVADQAAKKRTGCTNSLGYLTQVFEDPSGLNYETDYSVDPLGNILGVTQKGGSTNSANWHSRSYAYDYLSRLTQSVNPESGTVNYYYDTNGYMGDLTSRVAPAPNQTGSSTVTTTYAYDLLHRITQKSYSDGTTPAMNYWYDVHPTWGATWVTNVVGRLVEAKNQYGGTAGLGTSIVSSYDVMGRITNQWQQTPKLAPSGQNLYYSYDLAGNMLSASNGAATISYAYDAASRPSTVTSNLVDSQHPATLATLNSSTAYFPNSAIRNMGLGNGLTQTMALNNTLEPCRINLNSSGTVLGTCATSTPTGNLLDLNAGFSAGTANNGNVTSWSAVGQQTFNRTYSYDSLNRLYTLADSASGQSCKGLSWTYDAWGNLYDQSYTAGSCYTYHGLLPSTKNQLVGTTGVTYQYDSAGNLTWDGSHNYFYDAENRLIQVDGTLGTCSSPTTMCYVYDANGRRVEHTYSAGSQDYLFDLQGRAVSDWTFSSGYTGLGAAYVYLGSQLLAQYSNATTYFVTQDHLGSTRLLTATNQSVPESPDYYPFGLPFGDKWYTMHEFASTIADSESGLDHAQFRQYSFAQGRWTTPDTAGLAAVDPTNPQSWNRYAYVLNNPLILVDPTGLDPNGATCGDVNGSTAGQDCNNQFPGSGSAGWSIGGGSDCISTQPCSITVIPSADGSGGGQQIPGQCYEIFLDGFDTGQNTCGPTSGSGGRNGGGNGGGNSSTVHGQAYYFFHDFSIFGPKNDPRPSCFANFLKDTASNFIGYSGADVAGGVATATYILTPPAPVPPTMALRGGKYAANWIKAEAAGRVSTAAWTGLAANLVFAETLALGNELDSALNGNCK